MTTNRQPAGQPVGGQFAATQRAETGTELTEPAPTTVLVDLTENAFPQSEDSGAPWVISRVDAQRAARLVLPNLTDDEFFNRHWFGIESAAMQVQRFADDADGEEAAAASPADTLSVDLHDFMGFNEADRPGENDYIGYDFRGFAEAVTDEWRAELRSRVAAAVDANAASTHEGSEQAAA